MNMEHHQPESPETSNSTKKRIKKKWSVKKKWVIGGLGGCLGLVVLTAIGVGILVTQGVSTLAQVSNQAVASIFGESYKPANYMAMGIPIHSQNMQGMAMLIDQKGGGMVFAIQTQLPDDQMQIIRSGKLQQMQTLLKSMAEEAMDSQGSRSASGRLQSLRLDKIYNLSLTPTKTYIVCNATVQVEKRGAITYAPTSAALLPQANNGLVVLVPFDSNSSSTSPDTKFDSLQDDMQKQVLQIIKDSELDDRLSLTATSKKAEKPTTAER